MEVFTVDQLKYENKLGDQMIKQSLLVLHSVIAK